VAGLDDLGLETRQLLHGLGVALAPAVRRQGPAAGDEEIGPGQRLLRGKVLEGVGVSLGLVPVSLLQRDLDGFAVEVGSSCG
jgi:hypothetical protein